MTKIPHINPITPLSQSTLIFSTADQGIERMDCEAFDKLDLYPINWKNPPHQSDHSANQPTAKAVV